MALSLLKEISFREDTEGRSHCLHFLRTKDGKEIDYLITDDRKPKAMIEVKESDEQPSPNFRLFSKSLPNLRSEQWVYNLSKEKCIPMEFRGIKLSKALSGMEIIHQE